MPISSAGDGWSRKSSSSLSKRGQLDIKRRGIMNGNFARCVLTSVGAAMVWFAGTASAQDFPSRPIRSVIPLTPGAAGDLLSRRIGDKLKDRVGWTVLTDNKPGGDFAPAVLATVQAPADGYTILQGYMSMAILPHTRKNLAWDFRDIAPLVRLNSSPSMVAANIDFPANSLKEVVAYSKANPGKVSLGGTTAGSTGHLSIELLRLATGLDYEYVPYKDSNG